ncbi:MAG: sulfurtransferase [Planctomycetota bacterium]|nr:sulfurtransferase [Planctomycetota bacterium]
MTSHDYATDVLVSTEWVDEHRGDTDTIRIVESDEDVLLYATGHVPEAVKIDWINDLQDQTVRDYIDQQRFAELCGRHGIDHDTMVVFYGDQNNWWACYAFWVFKLHGHEKCRIMDGGRGKWRAEGRAMSTETPRYAPREYVAQPADPAIRAFRQDVAGHIRQAAPLLDVRSPGEYTGELLHMPDYPQEGALRGGHIPGAVNVPWATAVNDDGTFRSREELTQIYQVQQGLDPADDVIAYCRIGERSSHTWFVLKYLLGFEHVRNYDGSWTEWGNLVGAPIEQGAPKPAAV